MRASKYFWLSGVVVALLFAALWLQRSYVPEPTLAQEDVVEPTPKAPSVSESAGRTVEAPSGDAIHSTPKVPASQTPSERPEWELTLETLTSRDSATYAERNVAIHSLKQQSLAPALRRQLLDYLREPTGRTYPKDEDLVEASIKNDVIEWLRTERPRTEELTDVLVEIYNNPAQPIVMRDYALQHLAAWGETHQTETGNGSEEIIRTVKAALWEAVEQTEYSYAGTALLGLTRLIESGTPDESRLAAEVGRIAAADEHASLSRATALQLLGDFDRMTALQIAESVLRDPAASEIQLAAIALIGAHADETSLLESGNIGSDPRFVLALDRARKRIEARIQGNEG